MIEPDDPVWWCMCGNEGGVRFYGPYESRESAVTIGEGCQRPTSHHYLELSMRQLALRLPPLVFDFNLGYRLGDWDNHLVALERDLGGIGALSELLVALQGVWA